MQTKVILHSVRSVFNVGSIFRTCDAAAIDEVILCGYTPGPLDRFGVARSDLAKVALGAEQSVAWRYVENVHDAIAQLKQEGYEIVALEQSERSIDYKTYQAGEKIALILGNEPDGIKENILQLCDTVIEINMKGEKESLNVSVAAGVALFRMLNI